MQDDEILDEDFDIEDDFEDDFDLDEESDASESQNVSASTGPNTPQKKSFLQKFFMPIVIGVVALFAVIFAAGQGLFSSSTTEQVSQISAADNTAITETPTTADEILSADAVVVPSPAEDLEAADADVLSNLSPQEDKPLTPLPGEASVDSFELADLDAELKGDTENASLEENLEIVQEPLIEEFPVDEPAGILVDNAFDSDIASTEVVEDVNAIALGEVVEEDIESIAEEQAPPLDEVPTTNEQTKITKDVAALKTEAESLNKEKETLTAEIAKQRAIISALTAEIDALNEQKLAAEETAKTEKIIEETVKQAPKKVTKPTKPDPKKAAVKIQWELRSAQPGRATLSQKGSNDLKNIEIGGTLSGLGRIQSIQLENGLWVVRGTKGSVSQ